MRDGETERWGMRTCSGARVLVSELIVTLTVVRELRQRC